MFCFGGVYGMWCSDVYNALVIHLKSLFKDLRRTCRTCKFSISAVIVAMLRSFLLHHREGKLNLVLRDREAFFQRVGIQRIPFVDFTTPNPIATKDQYAIGFYRKMRFSLFSKYLWCLENKLLLISINFTPKTSHSCLKKWYTRFSRWVWISVIFCPINNSPKSTFFCPKKTNSGLGMKFALGLNAMLSQCFGDKPHS